MLISGRYTSRGRPDHLTTSEHSDRGCGEADSAADTLRRLAGSSTSRRLLATATCTGVETADRTHFVVCALDDAARAATASGWRVATLAAARPKRFAMVLDNPPRARIVIDAGPDGECVARCSSTDVLAQNREVTGQLTTTTRAAPTDWGSNS